MRYMKADETYQESVEDRLALEGDLSDRLAHLDKLEHLELRRIAVGQIAMGRARRADDHGMALGIIEIAFDEIERLSEQTLAEYLLMEQDIEDLRVLDAVVLKHGSEEFVSHYAEVKKRMPEVRAARRLAQAKTAPFLEVVG